MSEATGTEQAKGGNRLAILLAMAMFVLVVDTSLMHLRLSVGSVRGAG